ncbi:STE protein kinase [Trichoderma harzianum]|uniref:STE protein kinase n=1 Tax=Trichoderma harzianum TaxID=5544 RepID=A0A0F9WXT7_TRIHA|nr:STE protein kinase [Trichoderma harzianum]
MDSSHEDTFVTAPSQPPTQRESDFNMALAIISSLGKTLNETEAVGAEAETADSQCFVTQVEPRVTGAFVQQSLAAAAKELMKAKKALKATKALQMEKALESKQALKSENGLDESAVAQKKPLKTKSECHVTKSEIDELAASLTRVSLKRPDTRLAIAYPRDRSQYLCEDAVAMVEPTIDKHALFGILQREADADCLLAVPYHERDHIWITYEPMSDNCSLTLKTDADNHADNDAYDMFIVNLENAIERLESSESNILLPVNWEILEPKKTCIIQPGVWRILVKSANEESSIIDILLLKQPFNIYIHQPDGVTAKKRAATHYITHSLSTKRRKIAPQTAVTNETAAHDSLTQTHQNTITLQKLQDGNRAFIRSQGGLAYYIERVEKLGATPGTCVFSCRHSTIPAKTVAAKVLCHEYYGKGTAEVWRREKRALEKLQHQNIIKLEAFDGRIFTMFLEVLPPSLFILLNDRDHPSYRTSFQPFEALKILQDLSSALTYLSTKDIVHNDIKPGNIAYSPNRGTVLFDFGLARPSTSQSRSGTPWYLPPEFLKRDYSGFENDIWALGVTMIYIVGLIRLPERHRGWFLHRVSKEGYPDRGIMESWLEYIIGIRNKLCGYVAIAEFESLISQMLHPEPEMRVKAAELQEKAAMIKI